MRWMRKLREEAEVARSLLPLLSRRPWGLAGLVVLGVLTSLAEGISVSLFIPFLQSLDTGQLGVETGNWLVDGLGGLFQSIPPEQRLLVIALSIFSLLVLVSLLRYAYDMVFSWMDVRIGHRLRSEIYAQLLAVGYGFLERNEFGRLLNTLATETWRTSSALATLVGLFIAVCTAAVYVVLLLLISWPMTLVVLAGMGGISVVAQLLTRRVKSLGEEATEANAALSQRMMEGLGGMKVIRAFVREPYEQRRFDRSSKEVSTVFWRLGLLSGVVTPVYEILAAVLLVGVLFVSLQDGGSLPAVLVFIFILYRLRPRIQSIDAARVRLGSLAAAVRDVMGMLDRSDKPYLTSGDVPFQALQTGVCFGDVSFRYAPDESPALDRVSFTIPAGKTTAIVGPSGAGKSTLIKLLFRFYDPDSGAVRVDGQPLPALDLVSWRERIALVSQDVHLFNATIAENIAYGRLDATQAEIEEAARRADAHGFIERLPQGYATRTGDRGVRLSGGQQQRITLARAIVRDPELFILDEATNALDTLSEQAIQDALRDFSERRTVVVIAHRLSTVEHADHLIVLDKGRVAEEGTPQELLASDGLFARLYRLQYTSTLS
jgi:subfamily B ATP-binding cassette protein MsbA